MLYFTSPDNISKESGEGIGCVDVDWIHLAQGPMAGFCENGKKHFSSTGNVLTN
jgi:hypothetical protein